MDDVLGGNIGQDVHVVVVQPSVLVVYGEAEGAHQLVASHRDAAATVDALHLELGSDGGPSQVFLPA